MNIVRLPSRTWRAFLADILGIFGIMLVPFQAEAVVFFHTGDPSVNVTEPAGDLSGSGWQFQAEFGEFLGTPVAPHFFLSASHIGLAGALTFRGVTYTVTQGFDDPGGSDLKIWKVAEPFPDYAPLYSRSDETNLPLVVIGRGRERGAPIELEQELKGWEWGTDGQNTHIMRWGQNTVADVVPNPFGSGDLLYATFDQNGLPNEAHLSAGDSGGAVFIKDAGVWKLAGINYAVDEVYRYDGPGYSTVTASIFDARGFYVPDGAGYTLLEGSSPEPTGFYATRISSKLAWIYSVIDPTGSASGDGIANLLKYAVGLDPLQPASGGISQPGCEPGYATITYNKQTIATDLLFSIERSTDLVGWRGATTVEDVVQTNGTVSTIRAKVALDGETELFLRLRVTRP